MEDNNNDEWDEDDALDKLLNSMIEEIGIDNFPIDEVDVEDESINRLRKSNQYLNMVMLDWVEEDWGVAKTEPNTNVEKNNNNNKSSNDEDEYVDGE